jgi:glycosyltransferase involved in cell wall biosynthesis
LADAPTPGRILLVHERYQQAGGEDGVFDAQVALLRGRGHEVATLEVDNDEIAPEPTAAGRLRLAVDTVWSRDGVRRVRAAVRTFRPEVMHAHNTFPLLSPAIHAAARSEGVATVQTMHNYRLICPSAVLFRDGRPCHDCVGKPIALPGIVHACYRGSRAATAAVAAMATAHRVRRTWSRDVDRIVVLAEFARRQLVRGGLPPARVSVLPNFIAPPSILADGPGSGFLFVGRLTEDKGVGTILAAWEGLPPDVTLSVAGTGPLEGRVRDAAARNPAIRYLGRLDRDGVDAELVRARALLAPSHMYENCPLTVLEAFAAGRPVIASGHGGLAELVEDGVTGRHVRRGDPADLAAVVSAVHGDPAAAIAAGGAAREAYLARYTPDHGYAGLRAVYDQAQRAVRRATVQPR